MGEQSDPRREMEACRMASIEPDTKEANRGRVADAVGNAIAADALTRRAARADTQQASIALAIQLLPAFGLWVGSACVKHTGGKYRASPRRCYKRRQPAALKPRSAAAVWRRQGRI
jgi:hypothetical protein